MRTTTPLKRKQKNMKIISKLKAAASAVKSFFSSAVASVKSFVAEIHDDIGTLGTIALGLLVGVTVATFAAIAILEPILFLFVIGLTALYNWLAAMEQDLFDEEIQAITDREVAVLGATLDETLNSMLNDLGMKFDADLNLTHDDAIDYNNVIDIDSMEIN